MPARATGSVIDPRTLMPLDEATVLACYSASPPAAFSFWTPIFGLLAGWLVLSEPVPPALAGALLLVAAGKAVGAVTAASTK